MIKVVLQILLTSSLIFPGTDSLPNTALTPGDTLSVPNNILCISGYGLKNITKKTQDSVYKLYNITDSLRKPCVIDHLIPKAIGGSNSIKNLWPQIKKDGGWDSIKKDRLEKAMRRLICSGKLIGNYFR